MLYLAMTWTVASSITGIARAKIEPVAKLTAKASSVHGKYVAANAIDGVASDLSRWVGKIGANGEAWLELTLPSRRKLSGLHLYSGYGEADAIEEFHWQFRDQTGQWIAIPSAKVSGNTETRLRLPFDDTVEVNTDALRLVVTKTPDELARIKEVILWPEGSDLPVLGKGLKKPISVANGGHPAAPPISIPLIYLNQSGFNLGKPKRFTAPTLPDETRFAIHPANGGEALFTGKIIGHVGDFSGFNPDERQDYVVKASALTSVPFTIGRWHLERITYQSSVDFFIDSRHYVGNHKKKRGGSYGWRDDHHFAWVLRALVPQYLSNPAAYERMPKQIRPAKPQPALWGALEPCNEDAPDIVKLIHWGADVTVTRKTTHEFLKGELAYFLYAWPMMKKWLPEQNYEAVLKFVQETWANPGIDQSYPYNLSPEHNLFALKTKLGTAKGELPPGHNIMPNLLMFEVAKRDGLPGADRYFDAAYKQVEWMIQNLDWEDPRTTKGQRMSEHITMTALAAFLQLHPDRAPSDLKIKIQEWARIMVRRSGNLWDFRKLTDDGQWTPSGEKRTMWNEVGNVVGLPAALLAAEPFVEDPATKQRLSELVWSHMDNCFGRNPCGRHFSYDAPREIEGVEHGWYSFHKGGNGQLADARFVLDGSPKHVHYPYHPERGDYGWTEGWVTFNTAFNISLAYMAKAETELRLTQKGDTLIIRLRAPLNFDFSKNEPVTLTVDGPKSVKVVLREQSPGSEYHVGQVRLGDLEASAGDSVKCHYGFGYMETKAILEVD